MAIEATPDVLIEIRALTRLGGWCKSELEEKVISARQANVPWQSIADALGVKRQSAMSKFASLCDE